MADEFKSIKDSILKSVFTGIAGTTDSGEERASISAIKDLVSSLASLAGRSKDEIVQIISREIGIAVAGVIKEPLHKVLEDRQLVVTLELIPKTKASQAKTSKKTKKKTRRK